MMHENNGYYRIPKIDLNFIGNLLGENLEIINHLSTLHHF
jgi:hypothetical protein